MNGSKHGRPICCRFGDFRIMFTLPAPLRPIAY
jgi:hypothetical protein